MKKTTKIALSFVVIIGIYFFTIRPAIEREFLYPVRYKEVVVEESKKENIDPTLVAAVILAESKYKLGASSEPGAKGLMQVMPETAKWIQEQRGKQELSEAELHNPKQNIELGTWYLSHLLKTYKNNEILALAAYNAGQGHVDKWMKDNSWDNNFSDISKIPFPETKAYILKVLKYKEKYRKLYDEES